MLRSAKEKPMNNLNSEPFGFDQGRTCCAAQAGASEEFPFGPDVLVFRVQC